MKPLSIGRLSLLFLLAASLLVTGLGGYFWLELARADRHIREHERAAAEAEIRDAVTDITRRVRQIGQALTDWDETRQQLVFSEYYSLWRDERARDTGMIPAEVRAVALYDRTGAILNGSAGPEPMPLTLPTPTTRVELVHDGGDWLYLFQPVHADPGHAILLGYLGLKYDFLVGLRQARAFRYADPDSLAIDPAAGGAIHPDRLPAVLRHQVRTTPYRDTFIDLLADSQRRLILAILASMLVAGWLLHHLLARPLRRLSARIDTLRSTDGGGADANLDMAPLPVLELENVRRSFNDNQARLRELRLRLERGNLDLRDQALRDPLTGVFNRRAFDQDCHALARDRRAGDTALMLFDCDRFKTINDNHGHAVGDLVIRAIADTLQSSLRAGDRLYRIGGDEFASVLRDTDPEHARAVAERCLRRIGEHDFSAWGMPEPASLSIGIAVSENETTDPYTLLNRADRAMYTAKSAGGGAIVFHHQDMDVRSAPPRPRPEPTAESAQVIEQG